MEVNLEATEVSIYSFLQWKPENSSAIRRAKMRARFFHGHRVVTNVHLECYRFRLRNSVHKWNWLKIENIKSSITVL